MTDREAEPAIIALTPSQLNDAILKMLNYDPEWTTGKQGLEEILSICLQRPVTIKEDKWGPWTPGEQIAYISLPPVVCIEAGKPGTWKKVQKP